MKLLPSHRHGPLHRRLFQACTLNRAPHTSCQHSLVTCMPPAPPARPKAAAPVPLPHRAPHLVPERGVRGDGVFVVIHPHHLRGVHGDGLVQPRACVALQVLAVGVRPGGGGQGAGGGGRARGGGWVKGAHGQSPGAGRMGRSRGPGAAAVFRGGAAQNVRGKRGCLPWRLRLPEVCSPSRAPPRGPPENEALADKHALALGGVGQHMGRVEGVLAHTEGDAAAGHHARHERLAQALNQLCKDLREGGWGGWINVEREEGWPPRWRPRPCHRPRCPRPCPAGPPLRLKTPPPCPRHGLCRGSAPPRMSRWSGGF
jgi:hypothetical protein